MKVTVVIPARFASKRFPGKVLADISGKPMIQRVYEQVSQSSLVDDIFVAADDNRVLEAVKSFHGNVIMTRLDHQSGTDRVAEVAGNLSSDIFINVQGDEPLISPKLIDQVASRLISDKHLEMASAGAPFKTQEAFLDANSVKVLCDQKGFAIYFSRLPLPFSGALWKDTGQWESFFRTYSLEHIEKSGVKKHIGIYGYRRETLLHLCRLRPTPLELQENLEQLRAVEQGIRIKIVMTRQAS